MNQLEGRKVNPMFVTMNRADTSRVGSAIVGVFLFVILFVGGLSPARAQPLARVTAPQQHVWYNYFGNHPVSKRWGLHLEGQWRREGFGQQAMQLLLRPGVNFYLTPNVTLTGGYGFIQTHQYGEYPAVAAFPEHRFWQQALMRQKLGTRAVMQHRYRLEQRNIGQMQVVPGQEPRRDSWRYENRFRYMARVDFPLTRKNERTDLYLCVFDEMFVNFGRNVSANVFDQNRAYLALGKQMSGAMRMEVGYMNQVLQQRNGRIVELNHTMMVSVYMTLPFHQ